jgi:hypothetical protein
MFFKILGELSSVEIVAVGRAIRELKVCVSATAAGAGES